MNKEILEQYSSALAEIEDNKRRIQSSKDRLARMEEDGYKETDSVKGGEGGIQHFKIEGFPYPEYSKQKTLLKARINRLARLQLELIELTNKVEEYIASLENGRMRRILTLRYVDNSRWREIAKRLGPGNTEDGCRKEHDRFLSKK